MGLGEGRVAIVTGSARGIGREHALEFARQGAKGVVNDIGVELDGSGGGEGPAAEVVQAIKDPPSAGDSWDGLPYVIEAGVDAGLYNHTE